MRNILSISLFVFIASLLFISCDDEYGRPELYTPYMGEDVPDNKTKIYINNQIPPVNEYSFQVTYREKEDLLELEGDSIYKFPVKITTPASERLVIKCAVDEDFIEEYNERNEANYIILPSTSYVFEKSEVVIEKGETESRDSVSVLLKIDSSIKDIPYDLLLPIKIVSVNETNDNISSNLSRVSVYGSITLVLDNVDSSGDVIDGEVFNDNVTLESSRTSGLAYLIDGKLGPGYWYPSNTSTYLIINLPEETTIKGLKINSSAGYYLFRSVDISIEGLTGRYIVQGNFYKEQSETEFYIKFKTPVTTKSIRLQNFRTQSNGAQPDITELNLIK